MDKKLRKTGSICLSVIILIVMIVSTTLISQAETSGDKTSQSIKAVVKNSSSTDVSEVEVTPLINTETKSMLITPLELSSGNKGKAAEIRYSDLKAFAEENDISSIEIVTGLAATTYIGARTSAQTVIVDDSGNVMFEVTATGGQLRYDKKMDGKSIVGSYSTIKDKETAIDYADVRLQHKFILPSDINVNNVEWGWTLKYTNDNGQISKDVEGRNYRKENSETNTESNTATYISNVVVTNVPVYSCQRISFCTNMHLTFVYDGIRYTISQPETAQLKRTINNLVNYHKTESVYSQLDEITKAYIDAVFEYVDTGSWTPVA